MTYFAQSNKIIVMNNKYFSFLDTLNPNYNEDECYVCENFGFVLDGATGLSGENYTKEKTDALWLVKQAKEFLIENLGNLNKKVEDIVKECIIYTNTLFDKIVKNINTIDKPSCCLSLFRIENDKIKFFALGDCPILIKLKNGKVDYLICDDILKLDEKSHHSVLDYKLKHNVPYLEARHSINHIFLENRLLKNTDRGYYIFSDDANAVDHALVNKYYNKVDIEKIIILSDGYSQVFDTVYIYTNEELVDKINTEEDVKNIYNTLTKLQKEDKDCEKYNRFKLSDDASLICKKLD